MINHVRTLLLNLTGFPRTASDYPGEEYVPPSYRPVKLPSTLATVRRQLFGGDPDRAMMNYRLRELLTIIHGTEMAEYVTSLDPRVTYWPPRPGLSWIEDVRVYQYSGDAASLSFVGDSTPREQYGRLFHDWGVTITAEATATVSYYDPGDKLSKTQEFPISDPITLPGSSLQIRVAGPVGSAWSVKSLSRPSQGLPELTMSLESVLGDSGVLELFGRNPSEPYRTFRNLWRDHDQTLYRLGGLVLAVGYRTDEIWRS